MVIQVHSNLFGFLATDLFTFVYQNNILKLVHDTHGGKK